MAVCGCVGSNRQELAITSKNSPAVTADHYRLQLPTHRDVHCSCHRAFSYADATLHKLSQSCKWKTHFCNTYFEQFTNHSTNSENYLLPSCKLFANRCRPA